MALFIEGNRERVMSSKDYYTWNVTYEDGTVVDEYDAVRTDGRGFGEVDQARIRRLEIQAYDDVLTSHIVHIPDDATPVFFRRRQIALDGSGNEQGRSTTHCIGWKREEAGVYLFVLPDGSSLLSDNLQAV